MKVNTFKKTISVAAAAAMVAQLGFVLPASAEIIQTELSNQDFEGTYTAAANTEVVADPADAGNKVLKISNGASNVSFDGIFSEIPSTGTGYLTMDVYFEVPITGTATKDYSGAYFAFAESGSKLGTSIKVFGESTEDKVPIGHSYGGGSGQYGKTGDAVIGTWYTIRAEIDKKDAVLSYAVYDKAAYAESATEATPIAVMNNMGYRNGNVPNSLMISLGTTDGEYFYIDNVRTFLEEDTEAVEMLDSVTFSKTPGSIIYGPQEAEQSESYPVELSILGDKGSDFSNAEGLSITWDVKGLEGDDDDYIGETFEENNPNGSLSIKNGVGNFLGVITATVKLGDITKTAQYKFLIAGSPSADENQIYPPAGYPVDLNEYADSLVGYSIAGTGQDYRDEILPNWSMYGSNGSRVMTLNKDENGDKYIEFSQGGGTSGSTLGINNIGSITSQFIIDMEIKPSIGTELVYSDRVPNDTKAQRAFTVTADSGSSYTIGDQTLSGFTSGEWNRLIISCDMTTGEGWIAGYDAEGNYVGKTESTAINKDVAAEYFSVYGTLPASIKNLKIYKPVVSSMSISSQDSIRVPEEGEGVQTLDLKAIILSDEGLEMSGDVEWSLENYSGDAIVIEKTGTQTAVLKASPGAGSGDLTIVAKSGGAQATKTIRRISSSNNVSFTTGSTSITIPFTGEEDVVSQYVATTMTGDGEPVEDTITYKMCDKTGVTETTVKGVTFENGVLTVTSEAVPAVVTIVATNSEGLYATVKVNIHGLNFVFGSAEAAEGYTQVTDTLYNDTLGFGFSNTGAITVNENNVTGTASYTFKAKVPNGNYNVSVDTTSASMTSEVVETVPAITGITKSGSSFQVAVCDGILDLTFEANSTLSTLSISQIPTKTALAKPMIYSIGDSTTKNSGHYSNYNSDKAAQAIDPTKWVDEREYSSWGNNVTEEMIPDEFSGYVNHGMAGRDSVNYYNQARVEAVLLAICPGDYVTVNMGINSKEANEGASFETLLDNYYVKAIMDRGGIPVILTATPDGPLTGYGSYDESTNTFDVARTDGARNPVLKKIAEKYGLDVIDVGQWGEDYFNELAAANLTPEQILELANTANSINVGYKAPTTVLELVQSWYPDHNHYTTEFGSKIAEYILGELEKIYLEDNQPLSVEMTKSEDGQSVVVNASEEVPSVKLLKAVYNADGSLNSVAVAAESLNEGENTIAIGDAAPEGGNIKYVLLDSIDTMVPLCNALEI